MQYYRRFSRIRLIMGLAVLLVTGAVSAQSGPPPEVRRAVDALVNVVSTSDEAALKSFLAEAVDPALVNTPAGNEFISTLRTIRAATQGLGDELSVAPAPDGVRVTLGAAGVSRTITMSLSSAGITALELLPETTSVRSAKKPAEKPSGHAEVVQAHVTALEQSAHKSLEEALSGLEDEHFSTTYLASTTATERRVLVERIRSGVAGAGAIMLDENDGEVTLTLRGRQNLNVVFTVEAQSPYGIDTLRAETADAAGAGMTLTWKGAKKTFRDLEKKGFSGVVYLARGSEIFLHKAYGKSNRELGYDMQIDSIFGIGSTPIDFTISGIYLLAQSGKLSLDDTLSKYFPDVPADKSSMTIAHLITGQSGLPDFHGIPGKDWDLDLAWIDRETAVARILAQPLLFVPGTSRAHSHSAYGLAAAIIELVSGQGYFDFMRESIFRPAGMLRTGMYGDARGFMVKDFAVGYAQSSIGVPNIPPNWGPTSWLVMGSGGMYSTLGDMLRFYSYMRSGQTLDESFAARYRGETVGIGGSERGFYFFHASMGAGKEAIMMVNGEGRSPEMRALTNAMQALLESEP